MALEGTFIIRIEAPHFVAAVECSERDRDVIHWAPILYWMRGWSSDRVQKYCQKKKYKYQVVRHD